LVQGLRTVDAELTVIDFDRVEQKNTLSQFHAKSGLRKNKARALETLMNFMWGVKIKAVPHKLNELNFELLEGADLVVDCVDNAGARHLIQGWAREHGVPCLHGALAADGTLGRVVWDAKFEVDREPGTGAATCEGGEHLPLIMITAAYMARAVQEWLGNKVFCNWQIFPRGDAMFWTSEG
jgi:hypothetical protein